MGRTASSLGYQMTSAISACTYEGHSKRDYKQTHCGETGYRVFGLTYKSDLCETAKDLGRFVHERHPDVRLVRDIKPHMIQEYLDYKGQTCHSVHTVEKIYSHIRKIDLIVQHKYKSAGFSDRIAMPEMSADAGEKIRDKVMSENDFKKLLESLSASASGASRSAVLSWYAGLRLEETVSVRVERWTPVGGRWGYGYLEIKKGDGAKGNRPRHIDIVSSEGRNAIQEAVKDRQLGQYIVCKADGSPYQKKSITRTIDRHMTRINLANEYKQNKNHAMRKAFAQQCYDVARRSGMSKAEALAYVNQQLGHSGNRTDLSKIYVAFQW